MPDTTHDGLHIRSSHRLADYMPALAAGLLKAIGRPSGEYVVFLADFATAQLKAGHEMVFPKDLARPAAEMRVQRLLANPIEVDGVVFSMRTLEKRRMRQKSKQIVARVGSLPDVHEAASTATPASTAAAPAVDLTAVFARMAQLDARVAAIDEVLMVAGVPPRSPGSAATGKDAYARLCAGWASRALERLVYTLKEADVLPEAYQNPPPIELPKETRDEQQ